MVDTLIIGAGISGLSLAYALHQDGRKVLLCERQERVGGNITTGKAGGFLWEEGPTSFTPTPALLKLAVDVGLREELVLADHRLPRFVYWKGQLLPVPMSPPSAVTSKLLSLSGKFRALVGALGFIPPAIGNHLSQQGGEETVAQFFKRHLGTEVAERLVAPFVSGVYAGDVHQLSARSAFRRIAQLENVGGGLVSGAILSRKQRQQQKPPTDPSLPTVRRGELGSFKEGLQSLPKAIASHLGENIKLNWTLTELRQTANQTYIAEFSTPEGSQQVEARTVVLTTPAYVTAELLHNLAPNASIALKEIPYPSVACVVLAYPDDALKFPLKGFGNLIPRGQGIRTLGTIWSSSLFPGRAPQGWQMLTNFIGGATDPEVGNLDNEQLVQAVHKDLQRVLLKKDVPPKAIAVHLWKRAIPQYTLGHHLRLAQINQDLAQLPGLYLCSNYTDGVSLGDCVQRAYDQLPIINKQLSIINDN
ncbi:protoporphyrinogen oxidase [Crinalium epipsammum PCC 9333]|uniref:Coproporphyrinogen III oxidase n=1 Tax=Crinalium epipsammum PCC 9333 TaxID=1173022 RepID=K9VVX8_9CYAN|nr:protoporphyrinogen oxidase [Crinalium epipsammum]AFZ12111.1 protoporphyrinogen oxidase [Crinalium epipsammum PCC 9333]